MDILFTLKKRIVYPNFSNPHPHVINEHIILMKNLHIIFSFCQFVWASSINFSMSAVSFDLLFFAHIHDLGWCNPPSNLKIELTSYFALKTHSDSVQIIITSTKKCCSLLHFTSRPSFSMSTHHSFIIHAETYAVLLHMKFVIMLLSLFHF